MERSVFEFGNEYVCRYFFDVDNQYDGVEVSRSGNYLGRIIGVTIPDDEDEDEIKNFEKEVTDWLVDNE